MARQLTFDFEPASREELSAALRRVERLETAIKVAEGTLESAIYTGEYRFKIQAARDTLSAALKM